MIQTMERGIIALVEEFIRIALRVAFLWPHTQVSEVVVVPARHSW
jgi:hypothetical protein